MANEQSRRINAEDLQLLARIAGVEIAPDRLERLAEQVSAVYQGMSQLDAAALHDVEPASVFHLPWKE
jgi:Asp-tRNA(Asn)/Glu-tRNA(Gln) amidotransferase C subunit